MNKYQEKATKFLLKYPHEWHSFNDDRITVEIVCSLVNLRIAEINEYHQMRLKSKLHALDFLGES